MHHYCRKTQSWFQRLPRHWRDIYAVSFVWYRGHAQSFDLIDRRSNSSTSTAPRRRCHINASLWRVIVYCKQHRQTRRDKTVEFWVGDSLQKSGTVWTICRRITVVLWHLRCELDYRRLKIATVVRSENCRTRSEQLSNLHCWHRRDETRQRCGVGSGDVNNRSRLATPTGSGSIWSGASASSVHAEFRAVATAGRSVPSTSHSSSSSSSEHWWMCARGNVQRLTIASQSAPVFSTSAPLLLPPQPVPRPAAPHCSSVACLASSSSDRRRAAMWCSARVTYIDYWRSTTVSSDHLVCFQRLVDAARWLISQFRSGSCVPCKPAERSSAPGCPRRAVDCSASKVTEACVPRSSIN